MKTLLIIFIIIFIVVSLYSILNVKENYSSLDIYYPNQQKNQKPDLCGECAGICINGKCNQGIDRPVVNQRGWNNFSQGYLDPNNPDLSLINSPSSYNCLDDDTINKLISANYVYIYSDAFTKSLAFESYGDKSYVYIDPKMPNDCTALMSIEASENEFNKYCQSFDNDVIPYPSFDKHLPQKWRIDIKSHNPNVCLVTISSYSCNGLKYYLTAHKNGKVSASVFGGSNDQVWQILKNKDNNTYTNILIPELERDGYLIQSYLYNIYLTASNDGYMRRNAGLVSLTNVNTEYVGKENLWKIRTCGKRNIDKKPNKQPYKPIVSTLDFPNVDDISGPKNAAPIDLKLSKDVNRKWAGRSVWMPEFDKEWEGNYIHKKYKKNNKLVKIKDNNYKVVSETQPETLNITISLKESNDKYPLHKMGTICIDTLSVKQKDDNVVPGTYFTYLGKDDSRKYTSYTYIKNRECYDIKSSSASQFYGIGKDKGKIFVEHDKNRSGSDKIIITLNESKDKIVATKV